MKRSLPLAFSAAILAFSMSCGGDGDGGGGPGRAAETPTLVPLGNFNMSCEQPRTQGQQQQQIQTKFNQQQQQAPGCAPQLVFTEQKLSDWDVKLDCNRRRVEVASKGPDRERASLPISSDGNVKGKMQYQQQVQNDGRGNAVCWTKYVVTFDGQASCNGPRDSLKMDTQVAFEQSAADEIPEDIADALAASGERAAVVGGRQSVSIPEGAENLGTQAFGENPLQVDAGTEVTWTNNDDEPHTVTSDPGVAPAFDSGPIPPGGEYSRVFAEAGSYPYHCEFHPAMQGEISVPEVVASPTPTPTPTVTATPTVPAPLPTILPLPLPTITATPTLPAPPSPTPSPTPSPSPSPSPTPQPTLTLTPIPTLTPLPTPTVTLTPSPTPTVTPTPSPTPSPSPSPTPSRSSSPSPTPSTTITVTPIKVCVIEKPCPVIGTIDYSCPKE